MKAPESLLRRLEASKSMIVTSHVNPDGDALGSSLALAGAARASGRQAVVWHRDVAPSLYGPLETLEPPVHRGSAPPPGFPAAYDLAVALECPTLDRSGLDGDLARLPVLNIDHHLGNTHYGIENWVVPEAPAVACLVLQAADGLGWQVSASAAQCLYLGLHTDTGGFRFSNSTRWAFETAAALVDRGAVPQQVASWLYEGQPAAMVRLLGAMLGTLRLHAGGKIASVELDQAMFLKAGAGPADAEGLIDVPRSIAGVEAVLLLRQEPGGSWKGSLRSRGRVDVETVARSLDGGGHRNAAGFRSDDNDLERLRRQVLDALESALPQDDVTP